MTKSFRYYIGCALLSLLLASTLTSCKKSEKEATAAPEVSKSQTEEGSAEDGNSTQESESPAYLSSLPAELQMGGTEAPTDPSDPGPTDISGSGFGAVLNPEQESELASKLKEGQLYIYDSDSSDLAAKTISYDTKILNPESQINDYTCTLSLPATKNSRMLLVYDTYDAKTALETYLDSIDSASQVTKKSCKTNLGTVNYFTDGVVTAEKGIEYYYSIDVTNDSSFNGYVFVSQEDKSSVVLDKVFQAIFNKVE